MLTHRLAPVCLALALVLAPPALVACLLAVLPVEARQFDPDASSPCPLDAYIDEDRCIS